MGKRYKKKGSLGGAASPVAGSQERSTGAGRHTGSRRLVVWSLAVLMVAAALAVTWALLRDEPPPSTTSATALRPPEPPPSAPAKRPVDEAVPETGPPAARLEIPQSEFDFGFVPQKAKISHIFWLHSTGTDTLRIVKVNPG